MNALKSCSAAPGWGGRLVITLSLFSALSLFVFAGCGPSSEKMELREGAVVMADSISHDLPGITADTVHGTTHFFVRSANLKCRVQNVLDVTNRIEELASVNGGYVSSSNLSSTINYNNRVQVKADSAMESTFYTTVNSIVLQVPSHQLDTVLKKIMAMAVFVDYRQLSADDVKMKLLQNRMAKKRYEAYQQRLSGKAETAPVKQATAVADALLEKQGLADQKSIEQYALAEQVNYSRLAIEIYQDQQEQRRLLPTLVPVKPYEPGFLSRLGTAFSNGFELLQHFILFLANIWGVLLIIGVIILFVLRLIRNDRRQQAASR